MTNAKKERLIQKSKEGYMKLSKEQLAEILATIAWNLNETMHETQINGRFIRREKS